MTLPPRLAQAVIQAADEAVYVRTEGRRIVYMNSAAERLTGWSAAKAVGRPCHEVFGEDACLGEGECPLETELSGGPSPAVREGRLVTRSGAVVGVRASGLWIDEPGRRRRMAVTVSTFGEQGVQESRDTAWAILNATSDMAMLLDAELTIVAVNQALAGSFGSPAAELVGTPAVSHLPPALADTREAWLHIVRRTGQPVRFEDQYGERTLMNAIYPVLDEEGRVIRMAVFSQDVTQLRRVDEQLRERTRVLDAILAASPVGIGLIRDRLLVWTNATLDRMLGCGPGESVGNSTRRFYADPAEWERVGRELYGNTVGAGTGQTDAELTRADGTRFGCHFEARLLEPDNPSQGYIVVFSDVTERRQAEVALRESEARYRGVVDNIGIGIAVISPNMEVLSVNPQMAKWFPDVVPGDRPLCHRVFNDPPRDEPCSYCPTIQTLRDGLVHEAMTDTPSGDQVRHYRVVASPLRNEAGEVVGAIEMVEDCTERLRAETASREGGEA